MVLRVVLPEEGQLVGRQEFRRALHHAQHVVVGHVEHGAHLQSGRRERLAVHGQAVGVRVHVVHRAYQAPVRRVCRDAVDQVEPLAVVVLLKHADRAGTLAFRVFRHREGEGLDLIAVVVGECVFRRDGRHHRFADMHGEHLVVLLQTVLHLNDRLMAVRPADRGEVFVGFAVPPHFVGDAAVVAAVGVESEFEQRQPHVGVGGQRLRVAASLRRIRRIRRIGDVPGLLIGGIEGFEQHVFGVGRPPEAFVAVHFLARGEFGQSDLHRAVGRCGIVIPAAHAIHRGDGFLRVLAGCRPVGDVDEIEAFAGRVQHVASVRADARVEHRTVFGRRCVQGLGDQLPGARAVLTDFGQEQLSVDGKHHAIARRVDGVADDARAAFARAFATRLLLGRHVLGVGVGKQVTGVGKQYLAAFAVIVDHAHPQ